MAKCKECRFYESKRCSEMNRSQSPSSIACHRFSQYSTRNPNELKKCKDCRFYAGSRCSEHNRRQSPTNPVCTAGSICK